MSDRKSLYELYHKITGVSIYTPKQSNGTLQAWQESRIKEYAFKETS